MLPCKQSIYSTILERSFRNPWLLRIPSQFWRVPPRAAPLGLRSLQRRLVPAAAPPQPRRNNSSSSPRLRSKRARRAQQLLPLLQRYHNRAALASISHLIHRSARLIHRLTTTTWTWALIPMSAVISLEAWLRAPLLLRCLTHPAMMPRPSCFFHPPPLHLNFVRNVLIQ